MEKIIRLLDREIEYTLKINKRSKSIRLSIHPGGIVTVSVPRFVPQFLVDRFLKDKAEWILEKVEYFSKMKVVSIQSKKQQKEEYLKYKDKALQIAQERLVYFNKFYNFKWNRVTIRNQKTRWGSCSKKGNLNFNYKIALLNRDQADYIIVHELCHLKEFNHSKRFWILVLQTIPEYKKVRSNLKEKELNIKLE